MKPEKIIESHLDFHARLFAIAKEARELARKIREKRERENSDNNIGKQ